MTPLVSVVVPSYNHARFLAGRLESIFGQTLQDFEVILLDDHSSDGSAEIVETYRRRERVSHVVCNSTNSGNVFAQWDRGIALARGEWVWIAESDDVAEPTFLETLLRSPGPEAVLCFCRSMFIDEAGDPCGCSDEGTPGRLLGASAGDEWSADGRSFVLNNMWQDNAIANASGALFRRRTYLAAAQGLPVAKLTGDWLRWLALLRSGHVFYHGRTTLNRFRHHGPTVREATSPATFLGEYLRVVSYIAGAYAPCGPDAEKMFDTFTYRCRQVYRFPPRQVLREIWGTLGRHEAWSWSRFARSFLR
jgi:glycosyltransferase involved in cell wall biosynthesis